MELKSIFHSEPTIIKFMGHISWFQVWSNSFERTVFYQDFTDQGKKSMKKSSKWIEIKLRFHITFLCMLISRLFALSANLLGSLSMCSSKLPFNTSLWVLLPNNLTDDFFGFNLREYFQAILNRYSDYYWYYSGFQHEFCNK